MSGVIIDLNTGKPPKRNSAVRNARYPSRRKQCGAAVDGIGRLWIPAKYMDAKFCETDCADALQIGR